MYTSILELKKEEGSFSSRRLVERTGIRHVTDRTIRHLQARKKGLMSQPDKDQRVEFARKMQEEYSASVWTDSVRLSTWMVFHSCSTLIHWTKLGAWQKVVNLEREEN